MLRALLVISLAIAASARSVEQVISAEPESGESHSLTWLLERLMKRLEEETSTEIESKRPVCNTKECQDFARRLKDSMNTSTNPCDDFYEYTCGNFGKNNKPPSDDIDSWGVMREVGLKVRNHLKEMLMADIKPDDVLPVKFLKKWYAACMDTDTLEKKGMQPITSTLARIGGWPLAIEKEIWDEDVFKWQVVDDFYMRLLGLTSLHGLSWMPVLLSDTSAKLIVYLTHPDSPSGTNKLYMEIHPNGEESAEKCEETTDDGNDDDNDSESQGGDENDDNDSDNDDSNDNDDSGDNDDDDDSDDNDDDDGSDDKDDDGTDDNDDDDSDNTISEDEDERKIRLRKNKKLQKKHKIQFARKVKALKKLTRRSHKHKVGAVQKKIGHLKAKHNSHRVRNVVHKALTKRVKRSLLSKAIHHQVKYHVRDTHEHKLSKKRRSKKTRLEKTDSNESTTEPTTDDEGDEDSDDAFLPIVKKYYDYISDVAIAIIKQSGTDIDLDDLHEDIASLILFQIDLYSLDWNESYDNMTLTEFQEWYDNLGNHNSNTKVNWKNKVKDMFSEANAKLDSDEEIYVDTKYFKGLKKLIDDTPTRTIVNYIHWHYLSLLTQATTKHMRDLFDEWNRDAEDMSERHDLCLPEGRIEELAAYEYVKQRFSEKKRIIASDMIDDIQKELEYQMKDSDWLDDETRDFVLTKLIHMKKTIGYPEWYNNDTLVKQRLQGITIGSSFYENLISYSKYKKDEMLRQIGIVITASDIPTDEMSPTVVNAEFNPRANSLVITAADFESPLFSVDRPNTINFAILGSIMAHEVNHGFDNDDYYMDKHGEAKEWLSAMARAYRSRAQCFIEQYNGYIEEMGLSDEVESYGNRTLDENIADTMGVHTVYRAHKRRQRECRRVDDALPGFEDFSDDQMFFLSYGYFWCESMSEDTMKSNMQSFDPHSVGRLRIIGPVSNSYDFANAFNCPVGSPMNPEKKCNIWK